MTVTAVAAGLVLLGACAVPAFADRADLQTTTQISHAWDGGMPNGPSTHAVISNDKRYTRAIAFQSEASNILPGDDNGVSDVFAIRRGGKIRNDGAPWVPGRTVLISRTYSGGFPNGPSYAPAIDGAFHSRPRCVAFLSAASNIVPNDTNGAVDAFVASLRGSAPRRLLLPHRVQPTAPTTQVAISGNCKRIAFVNDGKLFVATGKRVKQIHVKGPAADPSFSTGLRTDLVFGAPRGVYLSKNGVHRAQLVARGGRNPAYNDIKRRVVTYEFFAGGHWQIASKDLGRTPRIASEHRHTLGNADSSNPVIGNAGYYITFQSDASNLGLNALARAGDTNGKPDVYLFTDVRDITLVQSVKEKAVPLPGGGQDPSMSFYANYIVFDSPAPLGSAVGDSQIFMRYLGPL